MTAQLNVTLHGRLVATITNTPGDTNVVAIDRDFARDPVLYRDGSTPSLAPAYDYVSTIAYIPGENTGMNLAGTKAFADIDLDRIARLASDARLSTRTAERTARDMVARMHDVWPSIKETLPIDDAQRLAITQHMKSVPLFQMR